MQQRKLIVIATKILFWIFFKVSWQLYDEENYWWEKQVEHVRKTLVRPVTIAADLELKML